MYMSSQCKYITLIILFVLICSFIIVIMFSICCIWADYIFHPPHNMFLANSTVCLVLFIFVLHILKKTLAISHTESIPHVDKTKMIWRKGSSFSQTSGRRT